MLIVLGMVLIGAILLGVVAQLTAYHAFDAKVGMQWCVAIVTAIVICIFGVWLFS